MLTCRAPIKNEIPPLKTYMVVNTLICVVVHIGLLVINAYV